jgi:hypothetical protein
MSLFLPAGLEQPAHEAHTVPDPPVHASPASYLHDSATLLPPVTPRVSKPHDYANHMFMRL